MVRTGTAAHRRHPFTLFTSRSWLGPGSIAHVTQIVRFKSSTGVPRSGLLDGDRLIPLERGLSDLLQLPLAEFRAEVAAVSPTEASGDSVTLLAPIDGDTEVWAAGVTYKRSEEARVEESGTPDIYTKVYSAERPEIFFKA